MLDFINDLQKKFFEKNLDFPCTQAYNKRVHEKR